MRELMSEFKELRLHGMAGAWEELSANGGAGIDAESCIHFSRYATRYPLQDLAANTHQNPVDHFTGFLLPKASAGISHHGRVLGHPSCFQDQGRIRRSVLNLVTLQKPEVTRVSNNSRMIL